MFKETSTQQCDLLVIGGGINGAGIARDAAGRGLSVILCEKDDLAAHTSSASSKLIHGGLRYLEFYEFSLVRKALQEREDLMRIAPHLISPLQFVMPYVNGLRPYWLLRTGLFVYDHLARRDLLPSTRGVEFSQHESGASLKSYLQRGFEYADAWVDDARLVVLNAIDARQRGAKILTRTECENLTAQNGRWLAELCHTDNSSQQYRFKVDAACIVNATGAWASQFRGRCDASNSPPKLRLIKGSHIVVKRLFNHSRAYIFQHPDGRIVFAIPYENNFTLIGTTDFEYHGDLDNLKISGQEVDYLCDLSNHYFRSQISAADVVHSFSGIRPLVDDGHADAKSITRDYRLEFVRLPAPALHVLGGKITTYRRLAEEAVNQIQTELYHARNQQAWSKKVCLPGGAIFSKEPSNQNVQEFSRFLTLCCERYSWLPTRLVQRLARAYGTQIHQVLENCHDQKSMGEQVLEGLYACEIDYLIQHEFAMTAQDILWRRSKLGLHLAADAEQVLTHWIQTHH